eukprot:TRINITY_DN1335_c0_g1_i1.p1 TRINITY_DN1335_c0_g1~~TRINITY_DN1335_c0_g1_i1.p1  ORF type:complete len:612 (-),score=130.83 TRINITY_DN1335_c0_g1_i1:564-2399(-)
MLPHMPSRSSRWIASAACLIAVIAVCASAAASQDTDFGAVIVANANRQIDLRSYVVRTSTSYTFTNRGTTPVSHVWVAESSGDAGKIATLTAHGDKKEDSKETPSLVVAQASLPGAQEKDFVFYRITLVSPLEPKASVRVTVKSARAHVLVPYPETIQQSGTQLVLYNDNHFVLSPYVVENQRTDVKLFASRGKSLVESYTQEGATTFSGEQIKYGPYVSVAPLTLSPMKIHFENSDSFISAQSVQREVSVSYWGAVSFTESYKLIHNGPRFVGEFSRWDFQRDRDAYRFAVRRLHTKLPNYVSDMYYRDAIGNISTSHVYQGKEHTSVELTPRFPLLGGWKVDFTWGYSVPISRAVVYNTGSNRYRASIPFNIPFDIPADHITTKILLPEGATNIKVEADSKIKRLADSLAILNLEIDGRPVLTFEASNVVADENLSIRVYYDFSPSTLLIKPILATAGFFTVFVVVIILLRIDLTVGVSAAEHQAQQIGDTIFTIVVQYQSAAEKYLSVFENCVESLLSTKAKGADLSAKVKTSLDQFKQVSDNALKSISEIPEAHSAEESLKKIQAQIVETAKTFATVSSAAKPDAKRIEGLEKETRDIRILLKNPLN